MTAYARRLASHALRRFLPSRIRLRDLPPPWTLGLADGLITKHRPAHLDDADFLAAFEHIVDHKCFAGGTRDKYPIFRLHVVWRAVRLAARAPGEFVEFGSYRGGNAHVILSASASAGANKHLHLYDTFSGIPAGNTTGKEDALVGKYSDTSVELVREILAQHAGRVLLHPGRIPDTLGADGPERIAFMHVDLNLAQPTLQALEWAFPKWSFGGICVLDDYLWAGYTDQRIAVEQFFHSRQMDIIPLPTGQGLVINVAPA